MSSFLEFSHPRSTGANHTQGNFEFIGSHNPNIAVTSVFHELNGYASIHEAARKLETYVSGKTNTTDSGHTLGTPQTKPEDLSGSEPAKLLN